jgi:hypothetical protein
MIFVFFLLKTLRRSENCILISLFLRRSPSRIVLLTIIESPDFNIIMWTKKESYLSFLPVLAKTKLSIIIMSFSLTVYGGNLVKS